MKKRFLFSECTVVKIGQILRRLESNSSGVRSPWLDTTTGPSRVHEEPTEANSYLFNGCRQLFERPPPSLHPGTTSTDGTIETYTVHENGQKSVTGAAVFKYSNAPTKSSVTFNRPIKSRVIFSTWFSWTVQKKQCIVMR